MALSVSGFPENTTLNQESEPATTATSIRSLFSTNSNISLATKVSPANNNVPTGSHNITGEDYPQVYDTAQVPLRRPENLPSITRPRQISLTSATSRRTPPPPASGSRQQYQQLQQRLDLASTNPPASRISNGMQHGSHPSQHGLPQPPTVKVHHDWATNSSTAGVSHSAASSSRPLPTIPMSMQGSNSIPSSSSNSGPIVESSKKAETRAATTIAGPSSSSSSSAAGPSSASVESPAAASSSSMASTSRKLPIRTTPSKLIPTSDASSSALAGPSSAIPLSTSPPTFSTPQLPPISLNTTRPRAQTTSPITHPLPVPQAIAGPSSTKLQNMITAADLVHSSLSASVPTPNIPPASTSPPQTQPCTTQGLSGPRPLPRIPPTGPPPASAPAAAPSTPAIVSSSPAVGVTYVSGSKTITTTVAGGSGSSAASSSSAGSSSAAGASTPKKALRASRPSTSPGPETRGNNLPASEASTPSGSGLTSSLTRNGSLSRSMTAKASASSSSPNIGGPSFSSLSISTTTSILKRATSASVSGATPILTSASTSSSSAHSSPYKDTPPTTGHTSVSSMNPILKPLPSTSGSLHSDRAPPASAPVVPTSGMPPRSRSQSRTRTRVTLPPSPPSHVTTQGTATSQPARRTLQIHQPVPVASAAWGSATARGSGVGKGTPPPLPTAASTSTSSSSSNASATTMHSILPHAPGNSMMRRGSAAAIITSGSSSVSTPSTTPPTTPGPSRSKPLPTGYGSKHSSTLSSGGGLPLGQTASMPSIGGGRLSSSSHGPLPPKPAMLYAAVPCPVSSNNANAASGNSRIHGRSSSQTQSQLISSKPVAGTSSSNSRSASLSREASLTGLGAIAAASGSRPGSRSNSKSRANSINVNIPPSLPSISTSIPPRPFKGTTASPASSPRLGFAPQPAFIATSSPISAAPSPISPDRGHTGSPFGATSPGSRATSPLGARARVRTTSPAGQRLFASSLGRKGKGAEWASDEDEDEKLGKQREEFMYGPKAPSVAGGSSTGPSTATNTPRPLPGINTAKEKEERRINIQREARRLEERKKKEEERREKARVKADREGRRERYRDEDDEDMHEHPTLGRMSSDSELGSQKGRKKRISIVGSGSRSSENGDKQLKGQGEAFVNDSDYEVALSRSPSPMRYARPSSPNSLSSSTGSYYEHGHTNALSRGQDDSDDEAYGRSRNRHRRRNGPSVDKARAAQLLSYRKSYRGATGPDELSDALQPRSRSASASRGMAAPAPRLHSASPSSSLRHLEGMAGHWKPDFDIGNAEMDEDQEPPSPIQYAKNNDENVEMLDWEETNLVDGKGDRSRRGTLRGRGQSMSEKDAFEEYGYGYGGGFEREADLVRPARSEADERSRWSDGETLHDGAKKNKKKTKKGDDARSKQGKPSQLEATLASVFGMGDGEKSPKREKKEKEKSKKTKKEKRKKDDADQTATFGTSSSGSLRTSRAGSSYSTAFAQSVSTLNGSVIDISSLPPTPPQLPSTNGQTRLQEVSMRMQVLEPTGRRDSGDGIGGSLSRLRTYSFKSYDAPTLPDGNPTNTPMARSKTDSKSHKRRSYSQGQIEGLVVDDPSSDHWTNKFTLRGQVSAGDLTQKALPLPPDLQRTESPVYQESRPPPSAWPPQKRGSVNDSGDTSSVRSRKTSGTGSTIGAVNLAKVLKFGPSVPVIGKAGRGGGVWVKNSFGSSVQ